jgi:F-type H+-transporting ATPase subunit b
MKEFLADKTGVTGFGTLVAGLTAVSISKEIIIFHNETLIGFALATVIYGLMKKLGSPIGEYLDQRSQDILDSLNIERNSKLKTLESSILANQQLEENLQCRKDVFEIMQENNALSLEEEYRQRQLTLYNAVKKRLDFQADYEATERRLNHEHLVAWVEQQVAAAVSAKPVSSHTHTHTHTAVFLLTTLTNVTTMHSVLLPFSTDRTRVSRGVYRKLRGWQHRRSKPPT